MDFLEKWSPRVVLGLDEIKEKREHYHTVVTINAASCANCSERNGKFCPFPERLSKRLCAVYSRDMSALPDLNISKRSGYE